MLNIVRKKDPTQLNNDAPAQNSELRKVRKRVIAQAGLAVMTVLLTVVIIFGMTAAWYTNVVQSGGLIFQVEELGVNVNASILSSAFTAKPGDSGLISLTAENLGTGMVDITVSANKTALSKEMQQRLYFYVETQQTQNGETSQRTYLTDGSGYTYSVFAQDKLTLTELCHNNAQLKWQWVYDVLGYYVLGAPENGTVTVQEYLRPIEYNYDNATFNDDGTVATVDGKMSAMEFLSRLSTTDGYVGILEKNATAIGGYYPIAVNENGYGVYAYLCTRNEVEANTDYDTNLGLQAAAGQQENYQVKLTVNAAASNFSPLSVANGATLAQEMQKGTSYIKLGNNISDLTETLTVPAGQDVILDLNGKTLTTSAINAVKLEQGSSLTVLNGTMRGVGNDRAFVTQGADLALNGVTIENYSFGLRVEDYDSDGLDSVVRISDCNISGSTCAVFACGNGFDSEQNTTIIIENSTLYSDNMTICGNGTATGNPRYGTDIQVINSTVTSTSEQTSAAIYHPQKDSTVNIYQSTIIGYTGIALKGGSVTVRESTVIGTGIAPEEPGNAVNGFKNTAAAISVETSYDYGISLTVDDKSTLTSYYADAVALYDKDSPYLTTEILTTNINNKLPPKENA